MWDCEKLEWSGSQGLSKSRRTSYKGQYAFSSNSGIAVALWPLTHSYIVIVIRERTEREKPVVKSSDACIGMFKAKYQLGDRKYGMLHDTLKEHISYNPNGLYGNT